MASAAASWRSPSPSPPLVLHLKGTFRGCTVSAPEPYWSLRTVPLYFLRNIEKPKATGAGLAEVTHGRYLPLLPSTARARAATLHTLLSTTSTGITWHQQETHTRSSTRLPQSQVLDRSFLQRQVARTCHRARCCRCFRPWSGSKGDIPRPSSGLAERLHLLTRAFSLRQPSISHRISGLPSQFALVLHHNGGIISASRAQRWLPPRASGRQPRRWP